MTKSVEAQVEEILDSYSKEVREATNKAEDTVAKEAVSKLKSTSPKGSPHRRRYAEGWAKKVEKGSAGVQTVIVYNRTNGPLTHLLENGHVVRNGKGTYGRARAIKHIAPVNDWAVDEFPREIERELE